MRHFHLGIAGVLAVLGISPFARAERPKPGLAGWYNILPAQFLLDRNRFMSPRFDAPSIQRLQGGSIYSQTARYDAATNLFRGFTVTLARNPDFKKQHHPDFFKKLDEPPAEKIIAKRTCWVWKDKKIIVPLDEDKAMIVEIAPGSADVQLSRFVEACDFTRIAEALAKPPRDDFTLTPETFRVFKAGDSVLPLASWCGYTTKVEPVGQKELDRWSSQFQLNDGSTVVVVSAKNRIESIRHETSDGKSVDLLKERK